MVAGSAKSNAGYRILFEKFADAVFLIKDVIIDCNEQACRLLACSRSDIIGQSLSAFFPSTQPDGQSSKEIIKGQMKAALRASPQFFMLQLKKVDGGLVDVEIALTSFISDDASLFSATIRDDRGRMQPGQDMLERIGALERSNKDLEQYAYIVSHDLQEPLRMVTNYMQLLRKRYKGQLGKDADEFIEYAMNGAIRMQTLLHDLLAYSKVGMGGMKFELIDCEGVLNNSLDDLQLLIKEHQAQVIYDRLPELTADRVQMGQLFSNLISNAIKFHGKESPYVYISVEKKQEEWIFSIRDNGIGIDPHAAERIFIIFQRLNRQEEYPGTGVGLAICKRIVERYGGRIWFQSEPGEGSTFFFSLPINL